MQDVIYLKNGSVIRGIIVEQIPNESIKMETRDGNLFVYKLDEISKLTKENEVKGSAKKSLKGNGYMGIVEVGYGIDAGGDLAKLTNINRVNVSIINGYKFNPYLYLGLGTGIIYYTGDADELSIPLYTYFKANFINNKVSPFASMSLGYIMNTKEDAFFSGLLLEPAVGVNFSVSQRNNISFSLSYALHQTEYYYYNGYYNEESELAGAITFKLGFSF